MSPRKHPLAKLLSLLRSRRLAALLLVALAAYASIATLGLPHAYANPVFLAVAALLTLSTATCAWERTRSAIASWRARSAITATSLQRLREAPTAVVTATGLGDDEIEAAVAKALRRLRLRFRRHDDVLEGVGGGLGLVGSPLFHWALVGLFLFTAAGQLTRYEGYVDVVEGDSIIDAPATYAGSLERGWFVPDQRFTGLAVSAVSIETSRVVDGVDLGIIPVVRLTGDGRTLREQEVYPNNPLRHGSLSVQRADVEPALIGHVRFPSGMTRRVVLHYEASERAPREFTVAPSAADPTVTVSVTPLGGRMVAVNVYAAGEEGTQTVGVGQSARVAPGVSFTVDALTFFTRLQVVNDWSVPWIYAMLVLGSVAAAVSAFVPPRTVRALVVEGAEGRRAHVTTTCRRTDPAFTGMVERALRAAFEERAAPPASGRPDEQETA